MSGPRVGIPFRIIDNPDMGPQEIFFWAKLVVLQTRQKTDTVSLGNGFKRLRQLSGFQIKTVEKLIQTFSKTESIQVVDEYTVTLLDGAKYSGKESVAVKNQVPKETIPTTIETSVDSDESPVEDDLFGPKIPDVTIPIVGTIGEGDKVTLYPEKNHDVSVNEAPEQQQLPVKLTSKDYEHLPIMRGALEKQEFADSVFDNWKAFAQWANSEGAFAQRVWQGDYWPPMLEKLKTLKPHWRGEGDWVIDLEYLVRNDGQAEKLLNGQWSEAAPKSTEVTQADIAEGLAALEQMEKETPW
jgi:hypothetical protein